MKKWLFLIVAFIVATFILIGLHFFLLDGISGWVISHIETSDTVYAQNYSDMKFRCIHKGSTAKEVFASLGAPLKARSYVDGKWNECSCELVFVTNAVVSCDWSCSPSGGSYHRRCIKFEKVKVVAKFSEFYID